MSVVFRTKWSKKLNCFRILLMHFLETDSLSISVGGHLFIHNGSSRVTVTALQSCWSLILYWIHVKMSFLSLSFCCTFMDILWPFCCCYMWTDDITHHWALFYKTDKCIDVLMSCSGLMLTHFCITAHSFTCNDVSGSYLAENCKLELCISK